MVRISRAPAQRISPWAGRLTHRRRDKVRILKIWVDDFGGKLQKISWPIVRAIIGETRRRDITTFAHVYFLDDALELVEAGVHVLARSIHDQNVDGKFADEMARRTCAIGCFFSKNTHWSWVPFQPNRRSRLGSMSTLPCTPRRSSMTNSEQDAVRAHAAARAAGWRGHACSCPTESTCRQTEASAPNAIPREAATRAILD